MSECENVHHVTEFNNTLKQLAKTFGREKPVIVKYQGDYKYVQIYDNSKEAKYPGIYKSIQIIVSSLADNLLYLYTMYA